MPPALVILDAQNDFFGSDNPNLAGFLATIPVINRTIVYFHQHGWPVIFLQHTSAKKPEGSKQWEIYEQFVRAPEDIFLTKAKQDAFEGSLLQKTLEARKAAQFLLAGYLAEYCVLTTYRAARQIGYSVLILKGGTASLDCSTSLSDIGPDIRLIAESDLEHALACA